MLRSLRKVSRQPCDHSIRYSAQRATDAGSTSTTSLGNWPRPIGRLLCRRWRPTFLHRPHDLSGDSPARRARTEARAYVRYSVSNHGRAASHSRRSCACGGFRLGDLHCCSVRHAAEFLEHGRCSSGSSAEQLEVQSRNHWRVAHCRGAVDMTPLMRDVARPTGPKTCRAQASSLRRLRRAAVDRSESAVA